jgi:hypothetical protein
MCARKDVVIPADEKHMTVDYAAPPPVNRPVGGDTVAFIMNPFTVQEVLSWPV